MKFTPVILALLCLSICSIAQEKVGEITLEAKNVKGMYSVQGEQGVSLLFYSKGLTSYIHLVDEEFNTIQVHNLADLTSTEGIQSLNKDGNQKFQNFGSNVRRFKPIIQVTKSGFNLYYHYKKVDNRNVFFTYGVGSLKIAQIPYDGSPMKVRGLALRGNGEIPIGFLAGHGEYYALSGNRETSDVTIYRLTENLEVEETVVKINQKGGFSIPWRLTSIACVLPNDLPYYEMAVNSTKVYLKDKDHIVMTHDSRLRSNEPPGLTRVFVMNTKTGDVTFKKIYDNKNIARANSYYHNGKIYQYKSDRSFLNLMIEDIEGDKPPKMYTYTEEDESIALLGNHRVKGLLTSTESVMTTKKILRKLGRSILHKSLTVESLNDDVVYLKMGVYWESMNQNGLPIQGGMASSGNSNTRQEIFVELNLETADLTKSPEFERPKWRNNFQKAYPLVWSNDNFISVLDRYTLYKLDQFIDEDKEETTVEIKSKFYHQTENGTVVFGYMEPGSDKLLIYKMVEEQ